MTRKHTIHHDGDREFRLINPVLEKCGDNIGFCQQEIRTIQREVSDQIRERYEGDIPRGEIGIAIVPTPREWRAGNKTIETLFQSEQTLDDILGEEHPLNPD